MKPNDAPVIHDKLFTLDIALDPARMLPNIQKLADLRFNGLCQVLDLEIEVMRRRNQRCVIRYIIRLQDRRDGRQRIWRVVGKVFKQDKGEKVFNIMKGLWEAGFSHETADGIRIPEPLAFSSDLCILLQEEVPGKAIKTLIRENPDERHMRLLARTLSKLHNCGFVPGRPFTMRDHLLRCHPRYPFLALACPELEEMIDYIVETATILEKAWNGVRLTPIHGDFHLGQVHIEGERAYLVDLDALSYGDPAADLGNIMVFLRNKAKKCPAMHGLIDAFLAEYFKTMDADISKRIPLYEGITHLRRACKLLRYQEDGWRKKARKMVEKAVTCIEDASHSCWAYQQRQRALTAS